jgi:hypothetical protein
MVCTLYGGPHSHEHYTCDTLPKEIRVQEEGSMASVYRRASSEDAVFVYTRHTPSYKLDMDWLVDFAF